jgi:UDP-N-acetylglucosamine--N-acetylmuramyl-(pentapeptide) pyrophosphoryl-undecaprenol N-acetylglucosamine transferase
MVAHRIFVSYEETARWLPGRKLRVTGNPLRKAIGEPTRDDAARHLGLNPDVSTVLVLGGSRGARSINRAFAELLHAMPTEEPIQFIAVIGESDRSDIRAESISDPHRAIIFDFMSEIEYGYAASDLVVSRAGATTISEILACEKPSILIPYPYAGGHQEFNALLLEKNEAAIIIRDGDLDGRRLGQEINAILHDRARLHSMSERARSLARRNAAKAIAEELERCSDT